MDQSLQQYKGHHRYHLDVIAVESFAEFLADLKESLRLREGHVPQTKEDIELKQCANDHSVHLPRNRVATFLFFEVFLCDVQKVRKFI